MIGQKGSLSQPGRKPVVGAVSTVQAPAFVSEDKDYFAGTQASTPKATKSTPVFCSGDDTYYDDTYYEDGWTFYQ
jgi:hypothetical protein